MFSIRNRNSSGKNGKIVNRRVIRGCKSGKVKNFDERKSVYVNNIEKILIDSALVNVNISVSNSSKVEARLYGQGYVDGDIYFDVCVVNRELRITSKLIGNCYNLKLNLDITVPQRTFKIITAESLSADIILNEGISVDYIDVKTQLGDLKSSATFANASFTTLSGTVNLYIDAKKNISVSISTMTGDISAEFNNISYIDLATSLMCRNVRNYHEGVTGYIANVKISTISGNIMIK